MTDNLNILIFDIETAPSLGYVWGKYDQTVLKFDKEWIMMSFSAKWLSEKKITTLALPDFPGYKKDKEDDKHLVKKLWELFDKADIIIAHNGDNFDIKKANARFLAHKLGAPSPYKTVDTLKIAKKYFSFTSNRLNDLGEKLNLGVKAETGGFKLWLDCMAGNASAWRKMKIYNKQDVVLLEKVYLALRPWMSSHPRVSKSADGICPVCGSSKVQKRGFNYTRYYKYQRYACNDCGAWSQGKLEKEVRTIS